MLTPQSKILVVDDYEMIRVMLRRCLSELGFTQIDEARDGVEALAMLESAVALGQPYSIVFSDLQMPNCDGIQLLDGCKANPSLSSTPFVMITAESDRGQVVSVLHKGADDYIVKPFSQITLDKKIQKLTERFKKRAA